MQHMNYGIFLTNISIRNKKRSGMEYLIKDK